MEKQAKPKIDLSNCKNGDVLILRDGTEVRYNGLSGYTQKYPHSVLWPNDSETTHTSDGRFYIEKGIDDWDVVEIVKPNKPKMKKKQTKIDLRKCSPGDKLILRNDTEAVYKGRRDSTDYPHHFAINDRLVSCTHTGQYYMGGTPDHWDVVEVVKPNKPKMKKKQEKIIPEAVENKKPTARQAYLDGQEASGIKTGDTVEITHVCPDFCGGWDNSWPAGVEPNGKKRKVTSVDGAAGIELDHDYSYPYFCLKLVKDNTVKINDKWTAAVNKENATITVGCQTFTKEALSEFLQHVDAIASFDLNGSVKAKVNIDFVTIRGETISIETLRKIQALT